MGEIVMEGFIVWLLIFGSGALLCAAWMLATMQGGEDD